MKAKTTKKTSRTKTAAPKIKAMTPAQFNAAASKKVFTSIQKTKIIPVIKVSKDDAVNVVKALSKGGINIAEVTYRTKDAGDSIREISNKLPEVLVGAGTICNVQQARDAVSHGAQFIVMPGFDKVTVEYCIANGIPVIPGVATPTEVMNAMSCGLKIMKLFPAEIIGGTELLKALKGPFSDIKFIPTGGITTENAVNYSKLSNVIAVGGTWIVKPEIIAKKKWDIITAEAQKAIMMLK